MILCLVICFHFKCCLPFRSFLQSTRVHFSVPCVLMLQKKPHRETVVWIHSDQNLQNAFSPRQPSAAFPLRSFPPESPRQCCWYKGAPPDFQGGFSCSHSHSLFSPSSLCVSARHLSGRKWDCWCGLVFSCTEQRMNQSRFTVFETAPPLPTQNVLLLFSLWWWRWWKAPFSSCSSSSAGFFRRQLTPSCGEIWNYVAF